MKISKTDEPCECSTLQEYVDDPDVPIVFDEKMSEYHIVHREGEGYLVIQHCPFCGGKAPESKRERFFTRLPAGEIQRLAGIIRPLKTLDELIAAFGPPDADMALGSMEFKPEKDRKPSEAAAYRTVRYHGLSETAEVDVRIHPDGRVAGIWYSGKSIKPPAKEG